MKTQNLIQLIKDYGKENKINSGEYLFKKGENNFDIFFIFNGSVSLEKDGIQVVKLYDGEILGEIGFLKQEEKSLSCKTLEDTTIYVFGENEYNNLSSEEKIEFGKDLTLFISDRVYNLNNILGLINDIDNSVLQFLKEEKVDNINNVFSNFIDLNSSIVLKREKEDFEKIYGDMLFNEKIENFISGMLDENIYQKVGKNYIYIVSGNYIYLFLGTPKLSKYVLENSIIYTESMFEYLGSQLENIKNKILLDNINSAE